VPRINGRTCVDLVDAARRALLHRGVLPERIYAAELCTMCGAGEFHSFRREGDKAGRMLSIIGITSG
jgi:copper oxidase (laccase) domain-containing protein